MLAIAVHLNSRIVIVLPGIEITCLNRTADSQIDREINVVILILLTDLSGMIGGTVIYDNVVEILVIFF